MTIDPILIATFADVAINLSAAWFGIAFILPKDEKVKWRLLTVNMLYGILCLIIGFILRKIVEVV